MGGVFAEKSFAVTIMLLMIVPAIPLPTGGVTHVFEVITVVLAAQMVLGPRHDLAPGALAEARARRRRHGQGDPIHRPLGTARRADLAPPLGVAVRRRWMLRLLGLLLMAFAIAAFLAPPFSGLDTLPAMGAVVVSLAIILEDVIVLAIGTVIGAGGIGLILTIGTALVQLIQELL